MVTLSDVSQAERGSIQYGLKSSDASGFVDDKDIRTRALGSMLRRQSGELQFQVVVFDRTDVDHMDVLLRLDAQMVRTTELYDQQMRTSKRLESLLALVSDANAALEHKDLKQLVDTVSYHSAEMFECHRCTFFTLDKFTNQLIGQYSVQEGTSKREIKEFRVPMEGIAGLVAHTRQMLNIQDAWNDPRFSKQNDLKTGYRTKTILCAPLTTSNGKVIAVLECINKNRHEVFGPEDEKMLLTSSYTPFIKSSEDIEADVKDMFKQFNSDADQEEVPSPAARARGGIDPAKLLAPVSAD